VRRATAAWMISCLVACGSQSPDASEPGEARDLPRLELHASDVTAVEVRHGGDSGDEMSLDVSLTPDARRRLEEFTTAHVGERVAIVVDGDVVMEPEVRDPITSGHLEITGPTEGELREMGQRLSSEEDSPD